MDFSNAPGPTLYTYRDDGRLETITRSTSTDPILSEYGYDTAGRLTGISHSQNTNYLAEYGYTLDDNGNREQVVITGSEVITGTETYVYDNLDRLINASYPGPITASFDYDKNGNRTEVQSAGITTTYQYDELGQLTDITDDAITPLDITIAYDNNGNRRTVTDNTGPTITREYTWDWANRLTLAEVNSVPTEYEYLGDSTRASLDDGTQTDFLYDRMGGLPQVIDDESNAYLHDVTGNSISIDGTTDDPTYPLSDALGSVRLITDDEGAALGDTNWDAWGNEQNTDGQQYEFGWTGQQYDEASDLTYLRARYYSPGTATFLSRDTVQPNAPGSGGYNPYSYANGNPTTFTDPSGHMMTLGEFSQAAGGLGIAVAMVFLYMAYVFECATAAECRFKSEHTDTDATSMARGHMTAREWATLAIQKSVDYISDLFPDELAGLPDITFPIIGPCLFCVVDRLYEDLFGKGGLLDELGYETVGICFTALSYTAPFVNGSGSICAVKDLEGNAGVSFSLTGGAGFGVRDGQLIADGFTSPSVSSTLGLLVSNVPTIWGLAGWSNTYAGGVFSQLGAAGEISIGPTPRDGNPRSVTMQFELGVGAGVAIADGATHTWVYGWDEVSDSVKDFIDEFV